jgi:prevent-host-death family protein
MMSIAMKQKRITTSDLKTQMAAVLDAVSESGRPVLVTRFGKPIARLVPVENGTPFKDSVRCLVDQAEQLRPVAAEYGVSRRRRR